VRLVVLAQGKLKDRGLRALVDDYLNRVRKHVHCDEVETKDEAQLMRSVPKDCTLVALEVHGKRISSSEFARQLERWLATGKGNVAFAIGGAEGLPRELSQGAAYSLSLSSFTLPHRLARLLLAEQLYRALSILRSEPYAREDT
jgi:23S rRNA (pseudouridine1915-N3)-methyltransferase